MPKYLIHANYVGDGIAGLMKEGGSARRAAVEQACAAAGGRMEAFYYAFGDTDAYVIVEFPDHAAVTALVLAVNATGRVVCKTTVLMTPEDVDRAVKHTQDYRAPGR